ncbi:MAG: aldehyde:ferredoxin oxidoreductase [Chlamydiales bacterium]|jgi:aldehyde:ferredoxin oxidoreductase
MTPSGEERVPQLLEVDLAAWSAPGPLRLTPCPWASPELYLQSIGNASGPALGLARFLDDSRPAPALVLCVGDSVRRGMPTAARASILAPSPLTGRMGEGQVGSDLGRRLATVADALVVRGRTDLEGALLHIGRDGLVELLSMGELRGADPVRTLELVHARLGECALLRCGSAGEHGIPFANLAAGGVAPSFVGRGGLGAAFGATGLKAIAISAAPVAAREDESLTAALLSSPRLRARGAGGTLELAHAFAARGDLRERGYSRPVESRVGADIAQDAERSGRERHGCKGCPTPCGWIFERSDGKRQGAHFSAVYALGTNLGLAGLDDALHLLEVCDRLGIDAKEAGACLALLAQAVDDGRLTGEALFGDRDAFVILLEQLALRKGRGALLSDGAAVFARAHDLEARAYHAGGEAARPESSLAAVLGQCVSARGAEPMRTFPFLLGDGAQRARIAALLAPVPLPEHADDARNPAGKGRLVWWHENLVAALDVTGFCAFSAAGLLADGVLDLDQLARLVLPSARGAASTPGAALLEIGAQLVWLHHLWNERAGVSLDDRPAWAAPDLALEGMLDEYRRWRGLDGQGRLTPEASLAWGAMPTPSAGSASGSPSGAALAATPAARTLPDAGTSAEVTLTGWGPLRAGLGASGRVQLSLPATVADALRAGAEAYPGAAPWLWRAEQPIPAVYRAGRRLDPADAVHAGDILELVVAVSGGST